MLHKCLGNKKKKKKKNFLLNGESVRVGMRMEVGKLVLTLLHLVYISSRRHVNDTFIC